MTSERIESTPPPYPVPARALPTGRPTTARTLGGILGFSALAGLTTGALCGFSIAVIVFGVAGTVSGDEIAGVIVIYGGVATIVGGSVGLVVSPVLGVVLIAARPLIAGNRWRGRVVAAGAACLPGLAMGLTHGLPWYAAGPFMAMSAIGAATWARKILDA